MKINYPSLEPYSSDSMDHPLKFGIGVPTCSRRDFLGRLLMSTGTGAVLYTVARVVAAGTTEVASAAVRPRGAAPVEPVVSFHVDRTYLDLSGNAVPYEPPAGTRSGQPVADLSDVEFFSRRAYY